MSLRIKRVEFRDFRSYETLSLHGLGDLTVFVGPNAVGKSNIVEGIQLLTSFTSYRNATIDQMVRKNASSSLLKALVEDGNRSLELEISLLEHSKRYKLNGKVKRSVDLKGLIPSVTFTPDDLSLVKGSMSQRRSALDALGSQINANYHLIRKDYEKVIRHKNALLKDGASPALISSIDEMVITCGAQLSCYRSALFSRMAPLVKRNYEDIAGGRDVFESYYVPSWGTFCEGTPLSWEFSRDEARDCIERALSEHRQEELARKRAIVGPHHDQIVFTVDGMNAGQFASQGQQRSVVLAYKLAEATVIEDILDQKPVLLLDDVMSELDGARREALVSYISNEVQAFITTANLAYFDEDMLARADIIQLPIS